MNTDLKVDLCVYRQEEKSSLEKAVTSTSSRQTLLWQPDSQTASGCIQMKKHQTVVGQDAVYAKLNKIQNIQKSASTMKYLCSS